LFDFASGCDSIPICQRLLRHVFGARNFLPFWFILLNIEDFEQKSLSTPWFYF
jgi:hypothetical protein